MSILKDLLGSGLGALVGNALFPGAGMLGGILGAQVGAAITESMSDRGPDGSLEEKMEKWNQGPESTEDALKNLYKSRFTINGVSPHFDTAEERDAYDRNVIESNRGPTVEKAYQGLAMGGSVESGIGGLIQGPGTVTSDDVPAKIMQNGKPVEDILVANGEVIISGLDLKNATPPGKDWRETAKKIGDAPNGQRLQMAARILNDLYEKRGA
jgi:hypothetical protein